jgi:hypothetical protein
MTAPFSLTPAQLKTITYVVARDFTKLRGDVSGHYWAKTAETLVTDGLEVANALGVPYAGTAAKVLPYVFDALDIYDKQHPPSLHQFLQAFLDTELHLHDLNRDIANHDFGDAARIGLEDALDIANAVGVPYTGPAKFVLELAFNGSIVLSAIGQIVDGIGRMFVRMDFHPSQPSTIPGYHWDAFQGWVPDHPGHARRASAPYRRVVHPADHHPEHHPVPGGPPTRR